MQGQFSSSNFIPSELIRILAGNELTSLDCGCCYYSNFDVLKIFNILISSLFILLLESAVPIGRAELEVRGIQIPAGLPKQLNCEVSSRL